MRRLFPPPGSACTPSAFEDRTWALDELADFYAHPLPAAAAADPPAGPADRAAAGRRAWLRANMVSSLDGAAHHDGRSEPLSCAADMRVFGVLRQLADAVVVGAGTVRKEGYGAVRPRASFAARRQAAGQPPAPALAVVSASLDLDFAGPLFTDAVVPTLVVTGARAPSDRVAAARGAGAEVLVAGDGERVDPARVVDVLAERGYRRLLAEGGPRLLAEFLAAGVLDELCLSFAPMATAGSAARIANGPWLAVPERFALVSVLEEAGFLLTRYRRN